MSTSNGTGYYSYYTTNGHESVTLCLPAPTTDATETDVAEEDELTNDRRDEYRFYYSVHINIIN